MMSKLYDKHKVPRAMLAYITDATASPLCILVPFGTWAVFYQSLFSGYTEVTSLGPVMDTYIKSVPFMFYGWASLVISLLAALNIIRPLGAMKKAYKRARETGELFGKESESLNAKDEGTDKPMNQETPVKGLVCFFVPVVLLIVLALVTMDVLFSVIVTLGVMIFLYLVLRVMSWKKMMEASMQGVISMTSMSVIVFMAYMLKEAITDVGLPQYVISLAQPIMGPSILPLVTFLACVVLTFTTGSNWGGTVGVTAIVIPLAKALGADMPLVLAAIVSGAAFGAHVCFYTDVTVFTSTITKIDNQEHAITQLPYGMIGMLVSAAAFLVCGFII
jgi:Na+/H+ antiporter NhaC